MKGKMHFGYKSGWESCNSSVIGWLSLHLRLDTYFLVLYWYICLNICWYYQTFRICVCFWQIYRLDVLQNVRNWCKADKMLIRESVLDALARQRPMKTLNFSFFKLNYYLSICRTFSWSESPNWIAPRGWQFVETRFK